MTDEGAGVMETYVLDLASHGGTDLHSWRLREEPDLDAGEIGEFFHGDTINAVRDSAHPGWLKLADTAGWVKESHEEYLVWRMAKFRDPEPAACGAPAADTPSSSSKDCGKNNSLAPPKANSSGSKDGSAAQDRALAEAKPAPRPFMGQGYRLGDEGSSCISGIRAADDGAGKSEVSRWFTGHSYRIGPSELEQAAVPKAPEARAARPRWADLADTDEEAEFDSEGLAPPPSLPKASPQWLKEEPEQAALPEEKPAASEPEPEKQSVRKPKRQRRNKALLQKRGKTQLCRYLVEEGSCPFGDSCWFAHSEAEMQGAPLAEKIGTSGGVPAPHGEEALDAVPAGGEAADQALQRLERTAPTRSLAPPASRSCAAERGAPAAKPQWADMADTDEEESDHELQARRRGSHAPRKEGPVKGAEVHAVAAEPGPGQEPEQEPESKEQHTEVSRRKKRNSELLQRKSKTQMCRYLLSEGKCSFGDTCWFAHSEAEIKCGASN